MFTGIVQGLGEVVLRDGGRLVAQSSSWPGDPVAIGESISVQGVCLTVVDTSSGLAFDLSEETTSRSTLGRLKKGSLVNLERAMRPSDRLGGHIVQGHVDRVGTVLSVEQKEGWWSYRFDSGDGGGRYLVDKGSITVDGVSLTVVSPEQDCFEVALIPFTYQETTLGKLSAGDNVNIEFDVLAKHVENLLNYRLPGKVR